MPERLDCGLIARSALLVVAVSVVLSGCALSTQEVRPSLEQSVSLPDRWSFANREGQEIELATYWHLLNDPLLDQFVAAAQAQNLDIAQAAAQLRAAQAGLREAKAARLPTVNGSGSVRRDVGDFAREDLQFGLGADFNWELDLFGRITSSINASAADLRASGFNLADLERVIVANVAIQTINARSLAAQLEIARASLANQDDNLQIAEWRNQAGLVSSLDVEQARTQRAQTAASIPQLEGDLVATANAISTLLGEPPGEVHRAIIAEPRVVPVPPEDVAIAGPADMLRMRPDVGAAEARLVADFERVGVARTQLYPLARLSGSLDTSSVGGLSDLFDVITGNVVGTISQLIFDGGRARAQVDASRAIADGSLAAWQQSIFVALEDVETAANDLKTNRERVEFLAEASDGANNAAILGRSQYQAGLIDFQVLLNVESSLLNASNSQVAAEAARAIAFVQLARAMGGGWQMSENDGPQIGNTTQ